MRESLNATPRGTAFAKDQMELMQTLIGSVLIVGNAEGAVLCQGLVAGDGPAEHSCWQTGGVRAKRGDNLTQR